MSSIKPKIVYVFSTLVISFGLLLFTDFFIGNLLDKWLSKNNIRIAHSFYHHGLNKNLNSEDFWGPFSYKLCTDENSFKVSCNDTDRSEKNFDLAFIGDSFTEGVGLTYEETFVGQIAHNMQTLKIANLGVSSYSPSIYLAKVNYMLEQGIFFKELIVYVDISDIQDEAISYSYLNGVVLDKLKEDRPYIKKVLQWAFPLTYKGLHVLKASLSPPPLPLPHQSCGYMTACHDRSAWTYNEKSVGYGDLGVKGGLNKSLKVMTELSTLLKNRGITLSIGVYPWPAQILYDTKDSKQVSIWQEFCKTNCHNFYNSFESFFILKKQLGPDRLITDYFLTNDVHHNQKGAEIIAKDFLSKQSDKSK